MDTSPAYSGFFFGRPRLDFSSDSASTSAESATLEMAMDLHSGRVESAISESELEGIYFNLQLYRESLSRIASSPACTDRKFKAVEVKRNANPRNLHGHVRAIMALRYALDKIGRLLFGLDLTLEQRQMIYGVQFGTEASLTTLEAYLPGAPTNEPGMMPYRLALVG